MPGVPPGPGDRLFATIFFVLIGPSMDLSVITRPTPPTAPAWLIAGFLFVWPFSASWRRAGAGFREPTSPREIAWWWA